MPLQTGLVYEKATFCYFLFYVDYNISSGLAYVTFPRCKSASTKDSCTFYRLARALKSYFYLLSTFWTVT